MSREKTDESVRTDGAGQVPMGGLMDLLASKYAMQIIQVVGSAGTAQFSDVEGALPAASSSTVSTRLQELTEAGLLTREQYDELPPRVEYELTSRGESLQDRLEPVLEWVTEYENEY